MECEPDTNQRRVKEKVFWLSFTESTQDSQHLNTGKKTAAAGGAESLTEQLTEKQLYFQLALPPPRGPEPTLLRRGVGGFATRDEPPHLSSYNVAIILHF